MIVDESASIAAVKAIAKKPFVVGPKPAPGMFEGSLKAAGLAVPSMAVEAIRAGATVTEEALGVDYKERDKNLPPTISQQATSVLNRLLPDPATTGEAGQVIFGVGKLVGKAVGYSAATGSPITGAVLAGTDEGLNEYVNLRNEGVGKPAAAKAGAIHGVTMAGTLAAPIAGATVAKTIGIAAATGPGTFMAENAAIREVLRNSGDEKIANRYDPTDIKGLIISSAPGFIFGAGHHLLKGRGGANVSLIRAEAERQGVSPDLVQTISSIETGGTFSEIAKNPLPGQSATGLFQVIDDTWKEHGGTAENRLDPVKQAEIGVKITAENIRNLTGVLGREPKPHEVYMAHLFGLSGAKKVLSAPDGANILDVVKTFDSKNAKAIVNNNRMQGMTIAQVKEKWAKFTREHTPSNVKPEEVDALRVRVLENHAMSTSLDPANNGTHVKNIELAKQSIDNNEPLNFTDEIIKSDAHVKAILDNREFYFGDELPDYFENPIPQYKASTTFSEGESIAKGFEDVFKIAKETDDINTYLSHPDRSNMAAVDKNKLIAAHEFKDNPELLNELAARLAADKTALPDHVKVANAYDSVKAQPKAKIEKTPEVKMAEDIIMKNPDFMISTGRKVNDVDEMISAKKLFKELDDNIANSELEGNAFIDAVTCFLGG